MHRFNNMSARFFLLTGLLIVMTGCVEEETQQQGNIDGACPSCCCDAPTVGDLLCSLPENPVVESSFDSAVTNLLADENVAEDVRAVFTDEKRSELKSALLHSKTEVRETEPEAKDSDKTEPTPSAKVELNKQAAGAFRVYFSQALTDNDVAEQARDMVLARLDSIVTPAAPAPTPPVAAPDQDEN